MHIAIIYKDYFPVFGGIEAHTQILAEGLAARGHRVTVLVTSLTPHDEIIEQGNLRIIKAGRLFHAASTPVSPRMLWHAAQLRDVDVIYLNFPFPPGDLAALAIPGNPPLVIYYHSDIVRQQTLLRLYRPLLHVTLQRARLLLASSPPYIQSSPFLRAHAEKCRVVPSSTTVDRLANPDPARVAALRAQFGAAPLILFVGRLRYYKGVHILLDALAQLRHPHAKALIVGIGPEEQRLRAQAAHLNLGERVAFLGEVSDAELAALFAVADMFTLPSHLRSEAFGLVQVEAQAAGLPVVCCELGTGTTFVTLHGQTGLAVPPAEPRALANALDLLLHNPDLARTLGAAGRERAREFTHERLVDRVEAIFREVV